MMMNEWASKLLSVFPDSNKRGDLDQFITEVNNDQAEQMYYNKEVDEEQECRPTFAQLSMERIIDEAQRNVGALKALDALVSERLAAYLTLQNSANRVKNAFEAFEGFDGSLKLALDSFYLYAEQEATQVRQQVFLSDLRRSLGELRNDAQRRIADYQNKMVNADKEVSSAEKKLAKAKEQLEKGIEARNKMESFELDVLMSVSRTSKPFNKEKHDQKTREAEEFVAKCERDMKDDARNLLRAIANRDQVLAAGRRAFQRLDLECKEAIHHTLKKITDKERENNDLKTMVLEKFDLAVKCVKVEEDILQFVINHQTEGGALQLNAQALTLLGDQVHQRPNSPTSPVSPLGSASSVASPGSDSRSSTPTHASRRPSFAIPSLSLGGGDKSRRSSAPPVVYSPSPSPVPLSASAPAPSSVVSSAPSSASLITEFTTHLSVIFYASSPADNGGDSGARSSVSLSAREHEQTLKEAHRKTRMINNDIKIYDVSTLTAQEVLNIETNKTLNDAVTWLCNAVKTQKGRDDFTTELNQFRSRKVELSAGFDALGVVLWNALSRCQSDNDVRTAKVIMMLSQTFFRIRPQDQQIECASPQSREEEDEDDEEGNVRRGVQYRQYIKEKLMGHRIWHDGSYWEQALWQCALEQLQTIPYEKPWYELDREGRSEAVRRVHNVIFSQVMAITHSMIELGCSKEQCREFLYRMCVIHQLSESHRQQLLAHVFHSSKKDRVEV